MFAKLYTVYKQSEIIKMPLELVKKIFKDLFKEQKEVLLDILSNCTIVINQSLDKLITEIQNNSARWLDDLNNVTNDLKLWVEASQYMLE